MDVSRLTRGEQIAGASGLVLILVMFIFDWFSYGEGPISVGGNAWDTMEFIRFIILLAALAGIAEAVLSADSVDLPGARCCERTGGWIGHLGRGADPLPDHQPA